MGTRAAAWFALSVCSLNIAFALLSLLFAALNGYSLPLFFDGLIGPLLALSFSGVGAIIASHRPGNPLGWIFLAVGFSQGLVSFANTYAEYALITEPGSLPGGPLMSWLGQLAWFPGASLMFTFALLLFPDGRLPSPLWRPVAWVSVVPLVIFVPFAASLYRHRGRAFMENPNQFEPGGILGALLSVVFPLVLVCGLASVLSLVVRFRRSRGIERQQLKWFTYAAAVTLGGLVANEAFSLGIAGNVLFLPFIPSIPMAAGLAILRYRLYEIDIIINRTLVYGALTVLLVAVYVGSVVVLQGLLRALTGQESQLAIVASTLVVAAMFNPLRRRMQSFIDRIFYRSNYDARKTLETFSAKLREETNLEALNNELVGVVRETMQPAHVSLWLRPDAAPRDTQAP